MGGDGQRLLVWPVSCFVFAFRCQVNRTFIKKKEEYLESQVFLIVILDVFTLIYIYIFLFFGGSIHSALMRLRQRTS